MEKKCKLQFKDPCLAANVNSKRGKVVWTLLVLVQRFDLVFKYIYVYAFMCIRFFFFFFFFFVWMPLHICISAEERNDYRMYICMYMYTYCNALGRV